MPTQIFYGLKSFMETMFTYNFKIEINNNTVKVLMLNLMISFMKLVLPIC